tara:strand:+ start:7176 stop:9053 length:1878 start_codon:yes stop_codon:yes gene_type:complete
LLTLSRILLIIVFVFSFSSSAYADSCIPATGKGLIEQSELIFRGVAIATNPSERPKSKKYWVPDSYTTFEVTELIKGNAVKPVKIYHSRSRPFSLSFKFNEDVYVFANKSVDGAYFVTGPCMPPYYLSDIKKYDHYKSRKETILLLNDFQALKESADKYIAEFDTTNAYLHKGKLLEDYKDYLSAKEVYEVLLDRSLDFYKKNIESTRGNTPPPDKSFCSGRYAQNDKTYKALKSLKIKSADGYVLNTSSNLLSYARVMYNLGEYETSLRALCLLGNNKNAESENLNDKIHAALGFKDVLNNRPIDVSSTKLRNVDLSELSIERSNFSNSFFSNLNIENSSIVGSDLSQSRFDSMMAKSANLSGVNFSNSSISANFDQADLSYVKATKARIQGTWVGTNLKEAEFSYAKISGDLSEANLDNVNFENADIRYAKFKKTDLKNTNFKNALYGPNTVWPEGFDIEKSGAVTQLPQKTEIENLPIEDAFNLPENTKVLSINFHDYSNACGRPEQVACRINVRIKRKGEPIFLVLESNDISIWHIELDNPKFLAGILLMGNSHQTAFRVPGNIKIVDYSREKFSPQRKFFIYKKSNNNNASKIKKVIEFLTDKEIHESYDVKDPELFIIN